MRLSNLQLQFTITSACVIMCFIAKCKIRKQQELIEQIIDEYYTEKIKIKKKPQCQRVWSKVKLINGGEKSVNTILH